MTEEQFKKFESNKNRDKMVEELMKKETLYGADIMFLARTDVGDGIVPVKGTYIHKNFIFIMRENDNKTFLYEIISGAMFPVLRVEKRKLYVNDIKKIRACVIAGEVFEEPKEVVKKYLVNFTSFYKQYELKTILNYSLENKYKKLPPEPDFIPLINWSEKEVNIKKEGNNNIFKEIAKKESSETLLSKQHQLVEMLLNKLKYKDFNSYLELKRQLDNIRANSVNDYLETKKELCLYSKDTIDKNILMLLYQLEARINYLLNMNKFEVDANIEYIYLKINEIHQLLQENNLEVIDKINKISELYNDTKNNISYMYQIDIAKRISYLYLLVIKKHNIDRSQTDKLKKSSYIEEYKNYLILIISELLEKEMIVTNKYEILFEKEDITIEDLIDIINSIIFVKKDKHYKLVLKPIKNKSINEEE